MKARRLLIDGVLIVAVVLMFAGLYLLPYLPPYSKIHPFSKRGKLRVLAPQLAWQTNSGKVDATVTLTLTNAGAIDLRCGLEWFDWHVSGDPAKLMPYSNASWVLLPKRASRKITLLAPSNGSAFTSQLCCYRFDWQEADSGLNRWPPFVRRALALGDGLLWPVVTLASDWVPETGYVFGSNVAVDEYFRRVHGLDRQKCAEEAARENEIYRAAVSRSLPAMSLSDPAARKAAMEEADNARNAANRLYLQTAARREVRQAFWLWLYLAKEGRTNQVSATHRDEPVSLETNRTQPPPNSGP